jgi:hypothetical protein
LKLYDDALRQVEAFEMITNGSLEARLWRAYIFAAMSRNTEAYALLTEVGASYQAENVSPFWIAAVHFLMGEKEVGFAWLEKAYNSHDGNINLLLVEVEFDGIRQDARYLGMLKKIGLSPSENI